MAVEDYPPGVSQMLAAAADLGLAVEVRARPAAESLPEAARILGVAPRDIAKTIVIKRSADSFLLAVVPGDRSIAWPKLRKVVGVNRLSLPDAETARAATSFERGTITPIGCVTAWPVYVDESLIGRRVAMGAGGHGYSAFLNIDDLITARQAVVADITGDPQSEAAG